MVHALRTIGGLAVLLCSCATAFAADAPRASFAGIGPVRIGMTTAELAAVLGHAVAPEFEDEENCYYVSGDSAASFHVMVVDGVAARIDVSQPSIATLSGARVGDTVEVVRTLYGAALEEQPHFYGGLPDLYLTYYSRDRRMALRFETHDGVVARYYLGYAEPAQYVEGCL